MKAPVRMTVPTTSPVPVEAGALVGWLTVNAPGVVRSPVVSPRVPVTTVDAVRLTPAALMMVRLLTVAGSPVPVTWAALPL